MWGAPQAWLQASVRLLNYIAWLSSSYSSSFSRKMENRIANSCVRPTPIWIVCVWEELPLTHTFLSSGDNCYYLVCNFQLSLTFQKRRSELHTHFTLWQANATLRTHTNVMLWPSSAEAMAHISSHDSLIWHGSSAKLWTKQSLIDPLVKHQSIFSEQSNLSHKPRLFLTSFHHNGASCTLYSFLGKRL